MIVNNMYISKCDKEYLYAIELERVYSDYNVFSPNLLSPFNHSTYTNNVLHDKHDKRLSEDFDLYTDIFI